MVSNRVEYYVYRQKINLFYILVLCWDSFVACNRFRNTRKKVSNYCILFLITRNETAIFFTKFVEAKEHYAVDWLDNIVFKAFESRNPEQVFFSLHSVYWRGCLAFHFSTARCVHVYPTSFFIRSRQQNR